MLLLCVSCAGPQVSAPPPLETLVLQETDLPEDTAWREAGPLVIDDPRHPLSTIEGIRKAEISDTYYIFALASVGRPSVGVVMNFAMRYTSAAFAEQDWEAIVGFLSQVPDAVALDPFINSDATYAAVLVGEEGTILYWSVMHQDDVLLLLVLETALKTEASDALFLQSIQTLEERLGIE